MRRILVVCTANSCRSQMAEAYLRFFAGHYAEIFSGGIRPTEVHPLTIQVMQEDNIDLSAAIAKPLTMYSGQQFDYVLTVCDDAQANLSPFLFSAEHIHIPVCDPASVEGEHSYQLEAFRNCREEIKRSMLRFIGQNLLLQEAVG